MPGLLLFSISQYKVRIKALIQKKNLGSEDMLEHFLFWEQGKSIGNKKRLLSKFYSSGLDFQHHIHIDIRIDFQDWLQVVLEWYNAAILSISKRSQHPVPNFASTKSALKITETLLRAEQFLLFPLFVFLHPFLSHRYTFTMMYSRMGWNFINLGRNLTRFEVPSHLFSTIHYHNKADTCPSKPLISSFT